MKPLPKKFRWSAAHRRISRKLLALSTLALGLGIAAPAQADEIGLLEKAADARWSSGRELGESISIVEHALRFGRNSRRGTAKVATKPLEDGSRTQVLYTHPQWVDRGTITGVFPSIEIPPGAHFRSKVGFVKNARRSDGVTFHLSVGSEFGDRRQIASVAETFDGTLGSMDVDLSAYAGQRIQIELRVDAGASSGQDWAAWINPRIEVGSSGALANFGYGSLKVAGESARGERPLLTIMMEYSKRKVDGRIENAPNIDELDVARFRGYMGSSFPNLSDYYAENSNGRFRYVPAGAPNDQAPAGFYKFEINGVCPHRGDEVKIGNAVLTQAMKTVEANTDFRFADFDDNRDGVLTPNELTLIIVGNGPAGAANAGAVTRFRESKRSRPAYGHRVRYRGNLVFQGFKAGFDTTAHELAHTLGTVDLYAGEEGLFLEGTTWRTTLMGTTGTGNATFHLDPVHKMLLGWVEPRIVTPAELTQYSSSLPRTMTLEPASSGTYFGAQPILVAEDESGSGLFSMIEYRSGGAGAYDAHFRANVSGFCNYGGQTCSADTDCSGADSCSYRSGVKNQGILVWRAMLNQPSATLPVRGIRNLFKEHHSDEPFWETGAGPYVRFGESYIRINVKRVVPALDFAHIELNN